MHLPEFYEIPEGLSEALPFGPLSRAAEESDEADKNYADPIAGARYVIIAPYTHLAWRSTEELG